MSTIIHLTDHQSWEAALKAGAYETSTPGVSLQEEGFIHCSLRHQAQGVIDRSFVDVDEVTVLVVEDTKVTAPIRYEAAEVGADAYPHIYGPLPLDAVREVLILRRDRHGRIAFPT
jgi:uncharacterized protein (DUF952 family)